LTEPNAGSVAVPTEEAIPAIRRYHLLLGRGIDRQPFEELVAEAGSVKASAGWLAIAESATRVSPVEADARLARWSRRTGRLAVRITRTDPERFWVAVHYQGERSFAMIHSEAAQLVAVLGSPRGLPLMFDSPFGSDPLLLDHIARGTAPAQAVEAVTTHRAEQLATALSQDDLTVEGYLLKRVLAVQTDAALVGLLEAIRATPLLECVTDLHKRMGKLGYGAEMNAVVGRAMFVGLILPAAVATTLFVTLATKLSASGVSPVMSFLVASSVAVLGLLGTREAARRLGGSTGGPRRALSWASPPGAVTFGLGQPNQAMREKWGGLFFLMRDIGFLANLERPDGPSSVYVDTWGIGPDALVARLNAIDGPSAEPAALYDLAAGLVAIRGRLLDVHLTAPPAELDAAAPASSAGSIEPAAIAAEVQALVAAVIA
jgi:hypothetical protein